MNNGENKVDTRQFHELAMDYRGASVSLAPVAYNALTNYVQQLVDAQASTIAALKEQLATARGAALEEAASACEAWGNEKVKKWQDDPEMSEDAKARAWDGLQCAAAIRALASQPAAPVKPVAAELRTSADDYINADFFRAIKKSHERNSLAGDVELCEFVSKMMTDFAALAAPPVQQPGDVRANLDSLDISGAVSQVSSQALASQPSAALTEKWLRAAKESAHHLAVWLEQDDCDCEPEGHHCGKPLVQATLHDLRAILAASSGAVAVPEGGAA